MPIKKSELYSNLWKSCDELRGGMDASQYKDYVLVLLFVKYVSDKYAGLDEDDADVIVPEGGSFQDIVALKHNPEIGDRINQVISKLAEENELKGIIDVADFNDENKLGKGKEMQDRLSNLVAIFEDPSLSFGKNQADDDDLLGDAYEYLMRNFATQSGKSKGQFYTPAEVSRVMAQVLDIEKSESQEETIYDPTCGSGSLLLKAVNQSPFGLTVYGQEMDNATRALAKMNMILHGFPDAEIIQGNTLADPHWKDEEGNLKRFNFAVANPPFSAKSWQNGFNPNDDPFKRFEGYDIPPAKNGDYAFLLHLLSSLNSTGKGAIILPHGVLFRGHTEANIRQKLIEQGVIKGIIGLPPNLFYGTGIPACIIVLDKENASKRNRVFMIDASRGYIKDGNKNRLREQDIRKIVDVFTQQLVIPQYSRSVPINEIADNDYNLNLPRYIDTQQAEDIQDIEAHWKGGIPKADIEALADYWEIYPSLKQELFEPLRPGYLQIKVPPDEVKKYVFEHPEFTSYANAIADIFNQWWDQNVSNLKGIQQGDNPKAVIRPLAESLLTAFENRNLIDKYDIYQHLMDYWLETMRDDVYILTEDGWVAELSPVKNKKEKVIDYTCELIPKDLIINRYFSEKQEKIEQLEEEKNSIIQQQEEMEEERSGEDDILADIRGDTGKVTKTEINNRIEEYRELCFEYHFPKDKQHLNELKNKKENNQYEQQQLEESEESIEGVNYLSLLRNKKGKITKKNIQDRVLELKKIINSSDRYSPNYKEKAKKIKRDFGKVSEWKKGINDPVFKELDFLHQYLVLRDEETKLKNEEKAKRESLYKQVDEKKTSSNPDSVIKDLIDIESYLQLIEKQESLDKTIESTKSELNEEVIKKYQQLTPEEVKTLVVDDKWMPRLWESFHSEMERISQRLAQRIQDLAERYDEPLPQLEEQAEALTKKVEDHIHLIMES